MTASYEQALLTRARELASQALELGEGIAATILGGARTAGLDPAAYAPLAGAALALGADQVTVYRALGPAHPSDIAFLAAVADAEDDARDLFAAASKLAEQVTAALDTARDDLEDALADLAAAQAAEDADAAADAAAEAAARAAAARVRIQVCERALTVLAELDRRLRHAIARLQAAPAALGETYESVYDLIRAGGLMPFDGRWLTGDDSPPPGPAAPTAPRRLATVTVLAALPGYLARHGWTRKGTWRGAHVWQLGSLARILVPPPGRADSGELAAAAVHVIARHEGRDPRAVLRDLTAGAAR
jgi:hypothetical protein